MFDSRKEGKCSNARTSTRRGDIPLPGCSICVPADDVPLRLAPPIGPCSSPVSPAGWSGWACPWPRRRKVTGRRSLRRPRRPPPSRANPGRVGARAGAAGAQVKGTSARAAARPSPAGPAAAASRRCARQPVAAAPGAARAERRVQPRSGHRRPRPRQRRPLRLRQRLPPRPLPRSELERPGPRLLAARQTTASEPVGRLR